MAFYLYKLKFTTPVHFGTDRPGIGLEKVAPTCHADTLFSALCQEAKALFGEEYLKTFVGTSREGKLLISDLFPYFNSVELCLPKPVLLADREEQEKTGLEEETRANQKKKLKKMAYLPVSKWDTYMTFLRGKTVSRDEQELLNWQERFFEKIIVPRVAISRSGEDSEPYLVGAYVFSENAGLYFIVRIDNDNIKNDFDKIINSLQYTGIGGKKTSGYGKFELAEDVIELDPEEYASEHDGILARLIFAPERDYYMTLSVTSPGNDDITDLSGKDSYFTLVPRRGFIDSPDYSDHPLKRKPLVMFNAGSCFKHPIKGEIKDVSSGGSHPVYRYGKALMLGVKL